MEDLPDSVSFNVETKTVSLVADSTIYPLEALYGASYVFIDRCFVFIDKPDANHFRVVLSPKKTEGVDAAGLRAWVGEFVNELLSCAWREQLMQANRPVIEAVTTQALAGAMGPPSLDDLAAFDFAEDAFEDPLGIAMSWEDKYKKKEKEKDKAATDETAAAAANPAAPSPGDDKPRTT